MNVYKQLFEKERKNWQTEKEKLDQQTEHMQAVCLSQESELRDQRQEIDRLNGELEEKEKVEEKV